MRRQPFLLALFCLALIEAGLLLFGFVHRHDPHPNADARAINQPGIPERALPATMTTPALYAEPDAGFNWLYTLVNTSKNTIDLVMYELVDTTFSAALVQACQRGVTVRVILDQNLEKSANTAAYNQIAAAGPHCSVAWANPQFHATHQKTLILDGSSAVVMTFNTTSRYYAGTRDFALLDNDTADLSGMENAFNEDFRSTTDRSYDPPAGHNLIWSPTTAQDDLVSLISGAKGTLFVENEELSATSIVNALTAACKRGVAVTLAMTDTSSSYHANFKTLQAAGCGVHIGADDTSTLYIHAKAIIADPGTAEAIGYVGSINFSSASMTENRELGLYVHDAALLGQLRNVITGDYSQFPVFSASAKLPNTEGPRP